MTKIRTERVTGYIHKDWKLEWAWNGQLAVRGAGIWKKKMCKYDKKIRLTIEEIL